VLLRSSFRHARWIFLVYALAAVPAGAAEKFPKSCTLPYNGTAKHHNVDKVCPPQGKVDTSESAQLAAAHEAQNRRKNELCDSGTPKAVTLAIFSELQAAVDAQSSIVYGDREHLPLDRTNLQNLSTSGGTFSEGDLVTFEGYVEKAKRGSDESCNCGATTVNEVDIHIHLVETPGTSLCEGIVGEMTPHYRPDAWRWTKFRDMADQGWPVRVTGQLFFDGSHRPCRNGKAGLRDPARISVWEIHPIYRFEVCIDEHCDQASSWVTVAKWDKDFNQ
jgi:hypothetical protein